jgi:curli biogenesis system outer membrane secretion channel CsgG
MEEFLMSRSVVKAPLPIIVAVFACFVNPPSAEAQKALTEGVEELARQIASSVLEEQKPKVAVLPFRELDGRTTVLGTYLAEELVTQLFMTGDGLEIVERTMLDKVLSELKLGQTGLIDPATAKEVGKVAGVDAVVTGTITDLQSLVAINCRLIDVQTGNIFGAAQAKIVKDDDVKKILGAPISHADTARREGSLSDERAPSVSQVRAQTQGFSFETKGCRVHGSEISCEILITNARDENRSLTISRYYRRYSRIIDDTGREYIVDEISLGSSTGSSPKSNLVYGVPIRSRVSFEGIPPDMRAIRLLEFTCQTGRNDFLVQLRNVPLLR